MIASITPSTNPAGVGDITGDGATGIPDFEVLFDDFVTTNGGPADITGDTVVGIPDFVLYAADGGNGSPVAQGPGNVLGLDQGAFPASGGATATFVRRSDQT